MRRLADESGETVNLMVPTPGGTEAIAQEDGRHLLGATNWIGRDIPDHASAAGKVFLAHGVSEIRAAPRAHDRRARSSTAPRSRPTSRPCAARGYATLVDELEPGLSVVAAPVFDAGGAVVAALAVSGPDDTPAAAIASALLGRVAIEQAARACPSASATAARSRTPSPDGAALRRLDRRASATAAARERAARTARVSVGDVVGALVALAVDEERRRAGDAARVGAAHVVGDALGVLARAQVLDEALDVEPEPPRVARAGRAARARPGG